MKEKSRLAILGAGTIGVSIAKGLARFGRYAAADITLTRRKAHMLDACKREGFDVRTTNTEAVKAAAVIVVAVEPQQLDVLLEEISAALVPGTHTLISVVSGATIAQITGKIGKKVPVVRAMPNTAVAIGESMTCIAAATPSADGVDTARAIFDVVGKTLVIEEEQMIAATSLGACGIAFFLRAIRAASQGGIEIGFHAGDALVIASQTAKGAAALVLNSKEHPEHEIDRVTTPRGCTISGLNQMEHEGFSSAMIKGIITSARKASGLYSDEK